MRNAADLKEWLKDQTPLAAAVLTVRSSLRLMPLIVSGGSRDGAMLRPRTRKLVWDNARLGTCIRSLSLQNSRELLEAVSRCALQVEEHAAQTANATSLALKSGAHAISNAAWVVSNAADFKQNELLLQAASAYANNELVGMWRYKKSVAAEDAVSFSARSASFLAASAADAIGSRAAFDMWHAITDDRAQLEKMGTPVALLELPLWDGAPGWWAETLVKARADLKESPEGYSVWAEWFDNLDSGARFQFPFPAEAQEQEYQRRLLGRGGSWWLLPEPEVNRTIGTWVQELSGAVIAPDDQSLAQNPAALTFEQAADGRIDLGGEKLSDRAADDADARDRHAEVLKEAGAVVEHSRLGNTQATDVAQPVLEYIDAMGATPREIRASVLVLRGNKLRNILKQRGEATSLAPPLSQKQHDALRDLVAAHNLLVALDPYLSRIEQAAYAFEGPSILIPMEGMRVVIESVRAAGLSTPQASETLKDAAECVPESAHPGDSRWKFASESLNNFIRVMGKVVKAARHAVKLAASASRMIDWVKDNVHWLDRVFAGAARVRDILDWIAGLKP